MQSMEDKVALSLVGHIAGEFSNKTAAKFEPDARIALVQGTDAPSAAPDGGMGTWQQGSR
jgi:hypothetical protein